MPVTVKEIFNKVGLEPSVPLKWRNAISIKGNGVYIISSSSNSTMNTGITSSCKVNEEVFKKWKSFSPELNKKNLSTIKPIQTEINKFWKPKENILYIGESSSETNGLAKRVNQFYIHQVGWKGPHTGGYWLKLLSQLEELYVYYAVCDHPRDTEFKMLLHFIEQCTGKSFYDLQELGKHLPFANMKVDFQKKHSISKAVSKTKISK